MQIPQEFRTNLLYGNTLNSPSNLSDKPTEITVFNIDSAGEEVLLERVTRGWVEVRIELTY
ncbi:MAG: hypothetical protein ACXITV_08100 [Luteibaculaceae bacterium]